MAEAFGVLSQEELSWGLVMYIYMACGHLWVQSLLKIPCRKSFQNEHPAVQGTQSRDTPGSQWRNKF